MTMADTVAVMNAGVIEQMGSPIDLYEHPRSTFVANFLGQSNLIRGTVASADGAHVQIGVEGGDVAAPRSGAGTESGDVWVGVRPEKVNLATSGSVPRAGSNVLRDARVSDVSFIGVSTQYLTRLPGGQEIMVFEQNTGARTPFRVGDAVDLHWLPDHTFLLDAAQDARAGAELEDAR